MNLIEQFTDTKLTPKEESKLSPKDLVMANMREALLYARTCCSGKLDDNELVSICYDSLRKTAELFKPGRHVRFFAYSKPRIRGAILRHFNNIPAVRNAECESLEDTDKDNQPVGEANFDLIEFREKWNEVSRVIAKNCTDRERALMYLVFSLNFTFAEAGDAFHISRAAAQAIAAKVIVKVKRILGQ